MAQQHTFTHTPRPPRLTPGYEKIRQFADQGGPAGYNTEVSRRADKDTARLAIETWGFQEVITRTTTDLSADQCEALARALLDAAHDLRNHASTDLISAAPACTEGGAE